MKTFLNHTVSFFSGFGVCFLLLALAYAAAGVTIDMPNNNAEAICFILLK